MLVCVHNLVWSDFMQPHYISTVHKSVSDLSSGWIWVLEVRSCPPPAGFGKLESDASVMPAAPNWMPMEVVMLLKSVTHVKLVIFASVDSQFTLYEKGVLLKLPCKEYILFCLDRDVIFIVGIDGSIFIFLFNSIPTIYWRIFHCLFVHVEYFSLQISGFVALWIFFCMNKLIVLLVFMTC